MICVTRVAKAALDKALAENEDIDGITSSPDLPIVAEPSADLNQPLIIKIDSSEDSHEKWILFCVNSFFTLPFIKAMVLILSFSGSWLLLFIRDLYSFNIRNIVCDRSV